MDNPELWRQVMERSLSLPESTRGAVWEYLRIAGPSGELLDGADEVAVERIGARVLSDLPSAFPEFTRMAVQEYLRSIMGSADVADQTFAVLAIGYGVLTDVGLDFGRVCESYLRCYLHPEPPSREQTYRKAVISEKLRWAVWERDGYKCVKCGAKKFLTVDHIVAESCGGATTLGNLQTLCRSCNSRKGAGREASS